MTIWMIGEAPTRNTTEPFVGRAGSRLSAMAGFNVRKEFRCTNVLKEWPGQARNKGAQFPIGPARIGAEKLLWQVKPEDRVIVVGGRCASKAFRFKPEVKPYEWTTLALGTRMNFISGLAQVKICMIPHPTSINQHWNDPANVERLREFLDQARNLT